jgi:hypothetical protein
MKNNEHYSLNHEGRGPQVERIQLGVSMRRKR